MMQNVTFTAGRTGMGDNGERKFIGFRKSAEGIRQTHQYAWGSMSTAIVKGS